jgi:hypothetical protein
MTKRKLKWIPASAKSEDITDEQYFQEEPWSEYISNSKLNLVDPSTGGDYSLFLKSFQNKRRSKAFQTGTIVHSLLLQENNYGISDVMAPSGKLGALVYDCFKLRARNNITIIDAINTVVKYHDYYGGKPYILRGKGKKGGSTVLMTAIRNGLAYYQHLRLYKERDFILNSDEVKVTLGCLESLKANDKAMEVLFPADPDILRFNEMAVAVDVQMEDRRFTLKIKIDNWTLDIKNKTATLNDLKTSGVGLQNFVNGYWEFYPTDTEDIKIYHPGSFSKYKYYRQLAMYAKVLSLYIEKEYSFKPLMYVNIVGVETKDPYWSEVFHFGTLQNNKFTARQLIVGLEEMERLLWILKDNNYEPITREPELPCAFI